MYRIELSPTDETVFRSIEELAVAIKRGVVTPRARIYHNASGKWLPIQLHPHYKAALSMQLTQAALVAGPPKQPLSKLSLEEPKEPEVPPSLPVSVATYAAPFEAPTKRKTATRSEPPKTTKPSRRARKPRRQLRIALVGALLIGGAQWVLSAPLFSRADAPGLLRVQQHLIATPTETMQRVSSPNSAAMMPVLPSSAAPGSVQVDGMAEAYPEQAPSFGGSAEAATEMPDIQPAPSRLEVGSAPSADSLGVTVADSSGSKALKRILRSVSGARPPGNTSSPR